MQYAFKTGLSDTESDQQVGRPAAGTFLKDVPPLVSDTSSDEAEARGNEGPGGSNAMTAQGGSRGGGDGGGGGGEGGGRARAGDDIGAVVENQISQTIGPNLETRLEDHVEANDDHADVLTLLAANIPACPTPDQGNEADDEGDGDVGHGDQSEAADHSSDSEDAGVSQHPEPPTIRSPPSPVPHERPSDHHTADGDRIVYRSFEDGDDDQEGDQEAVNISSLAHSLTDQDQDEVWMSYVRNQLSALFPDFFDPSLTTSTSSAIPATGLPTPMTGSFDQSRQYHSEHDEADGAVMGRYGHGAYHGSGAETVPNVRMEIGSLREEIERLRGVVSGLADNMSLVDITPKVPGDRTSIEGQVQDLSTEDAEGDISLVEPGPDDESVHLNAGERDVAERTGIKPSEVVPREETQLPEAFLKVRIPHRLIDVWADGSYCRPRNSPTASSSACPKHSARLLQKRQRLSTPLQPPTRISSTRETSKISTPRCRSGQRHPTSSRSKIRTSIGLQCATRIMTKRHRNDTTSQDDRLDLFEVAINTI
jgi:hypothetical protein